jgi:hypothetical protein
MGAAQQQQSAAAHGHGGQPGARAPAGAAPSLPSPSGPVQPAAGVPDPSHGWARATTPRAPSLP